MNQYEVIFQARVRGVARVTAKSEKAAEGKIHKLGQPSAALEFLGESNITHIGWDALGYPAPTRPLPR